MLQTICRRLPSSLKFVKFSAFTIDTRNLAKDSKTKDTVYKKTPKGKFDEEFDESPKSYSETEPLEPYENSTNPSTGEVGGPKGPEPTRYGDWERKGRCIDF
jgi:hypothetical protein